MEKFCSQHVILGDCKLDDKQFNIKIQITSNPALDAYDAMYVLKCIAKLHEANHKRDVKYMLNLLKTGDSSDDNIDNLEFG